MRPVYLDHHATTPVDPAVLAAMLPYFSDTFGNASSRQHDYGREAHAAVEDARAAVARLIGARPGDIVFTSGATESDNLAVRGLGEAHRAKGGHVVTTVLEHAAVLEPCRSLERAGLRISRVETSESGVLDPQRVIDAMEPGTILVSVIAAHNEIGTIQPVAEIGRACRERGIPFHTDAVQALGRIPVDVEAWNVDLLSISAHKMYGPKGIGALYVRKDRRPRLKLAPLLKGGGQEKGIRSGTLNVPGIVGLGEACGQVEKAFATGEPQRIAALRDHLLAALESCVGGIRVNGALSPRLPGNLHVSIDRAEAETLILSLGGKLALSSGAACAEAGGKGSYVLRALGLGDERVYTALRFGLGRYNTVAEIDTVVALLADAVEASRARAKAAPR